MSVLPLMLSVIACVAVAGLSLLAAMGSLRKLSLFQNPIERLLIGVVCTFLSINAFLALISILPIDRPLRTLLIPLHFVLLVGICSLAGWRGSATALTEPLPKLKEVIIRLPLTLKAASAILLGLLALYGLAGLLTVPFHVDELSYHAPQAIGAFQEGRIRSFGSQVSWLFYYPQGAANVWAWTMFFTGNTFLFRAVQWVFGVQLLLATWLLARRSGASETAASLSVVIAGTSAIFYVVVTTCNDDIGNAAAIVTVLSFLAPAPISGKDGIHSDIVGACLALSEACLIKVPFVAGFFTLIGIAGFIWTRASVSDGLGNLRRTIKMPIVWVAGSVLALSCFTYVFNELSTGNPLYPILIKLGKHVVFGGNVLPGSFGPGTSPFSSDMSFPVRWTKVFSDWYIPINENSLGTSGLVFPLVILFWAFIAILDGVRLRNRWTLVLACLALSMFIVPDAWLPRYGIPWLSIWIVLASLSFTAVSGKILSLPSGIIIIVMLSSIPQVLDVYHIFLWVKSNAAPLPWYQDRGRSVPEHYDVNRSLAPSAHLVHAIRTNVGAGTLLAWCVDAYPYLLWNLTFSNRIHYLEGCDPCPPCGQIDGDADLLYRPIAQEGPDWLLLYSSSALAQKLLSYPALSYTPVFSDSFTGSPNDRFNMVLFRHIVPSK